MARSIHFWLGKDTTKDESGAAALLSVALDDMFGGAATQHREVQGAESADFRQLFAKGLMYLDGGVESAFTKVERDKYATRLLHVKGRRFVRVTQVPAAVASLNSGDVFILDQGLAIFQWNGRGASRREKAKALDVVLDLGAERGGRAKVEVLDEGDVASEAATAFFAALGCASAADARIQTAEEGGADDAAEAVGIHLFALSADGPAGEEPQQPLRKACLASDKVHLLVSGGRYWVWVGKGAEADAKRNAVPAALAALAAAKLPSEQALEVVKEGTEKALFKQQFHEWEPVQVTNPVANQAQLKAKQRTKAEVDIARMFASAGGEEGAAAGGVDLGQLDVTVWRIENFELNEWPVERRGEFFAGDCFLVRSSAKDGSHHMVYFWQGRDSTADERGASALQAKEMDAQLGGQATLCRVVQNKEPAHFIALFGGRMVVHAGGIPSGFQKKDGTEAEPEPAAGGSKLFHVKGTTPIATRAIEVECRCASLNSGDCFVACGADGAFVWQGAGASAEEKEVAHAVGAKLAPGEPVTLAEGEESDAFWDLLGGRGDYDQSLAAAPEREAPPRLFQLCDAVVGGLGIAAEEIFDFSQDDLEADDVMLLDAGEELYLWIGPGATANEKAESVGLAKRYIEHAAQNEGRDPDLPIVQVKAGGEPLSFTSHFAGWDPKAKEGFSDPYQAKLEQVAQARREREAAEAAADAAAEAAAPKAAAPEISSDDRKFSHEELKGMKKGSGIDLAAKEKYLSAEEFEAVFKMTAAEFAEMKLWRQQAEKKKVGLF